MHSINTEEERELILLASECLFCEKPECMRVFDLDIRGILRILAVGNFYGAERIIKKYINSIVGGMITETRIKTSEDSCIRLKKSGKALQIEKILKLLPEVIN